MMFDESTEYMEHIIHGDGKPELHMYSLSMPKTYHSAAINDKLRAAL
jgi:hypothetical protein